MQHSRPHTTSPAALRCPNTRCARCIRFTQCTRCHPLPCKPCRTPSRIAPCSTAGRTAPHLQHCVVRRSKRPDRRPRHHDGHRPAGERRPGLPGQPIERRQLLEEQHEAVAAEHEAAVHCSGLVADAGAVGLDREASRAKGTDDVKPGAEGGGDETGLGEEQGVEMAKEMESGVAQGGAGEFPEGTSIER